MGVPVCKASGDQLVPQVITDGSGGAIITWQSSYQNDSDIYAQRISANGSRLWGASGIAVCTAGDVQYSPEITTDGSGGAIIVWVDERDMNSNGERDFYAQRLNANGTELWTAQGKKIYIDYSFVQLVNLNIISDRQHGAILTFECIIYDSYYNTNYFETWCQRVNSSGDTPWGIYGILLSTEDDGREPAVATDGAGGAIFTWRDRRNGAWDIYAQHIDDAGASTWGTGGVAICTKYDDQRKPRMISDKAGGAIITWNNDFNDIYAQNVCQSGALGYCNYPTAVIQADKFNGFAPLTIKFDGSKSYSSISTIVRWEWDFGYGGQLMPKKVSHTYNKPGEYTVRLRVKDDNGYWSAKTEKTVKVFSLDSVDAAIWSHPKYVKSGGKDPAHIYAACYEISSGNKKNFVFTDKPSLADDSLPAASRKVIKDNLGLYFTTTAGTLQKDVIFDSEGDESPFATVTASN